MSRRIVITGATGFVGRNLVGALLEKEFRLTLAVRDVGRSRRALPDHPNVDLVPYASILAGDGLRGAAAVVHLAGLAHAPSGTEEAAFQKANADNTLQVAESVRRSKIPLFLHISSIAAVTANASDQLIDDMTPPRPVTAYGRSKLAAEQHVAALAKEGVCAVSLRPPLILGHDAGGNWGKLQRLALSGLPLPFGSLGNRRSIISIDLLVSAIGAICAQDPAPAKSGNYCIADPLVISTADMLTELRAGMRMSPRLFPSPEAMFHLIGRLTGRQPLVDSLVGDLVIDASRFFSVFSIPDFPSLRASIRKSGELYRSLHRQPAQLIGSSS